MAKKKAKKKKKVAKKKKTTTGVTRMFHNKKVKALTADLEVAHDYSKGLEIQIKDLKNQKDMAKEKYELQEKKAVAALEDKLQKTTNELEKQYNDRIAEFKEQELTKMHAKMTKINEDNYKQLKSEVAKIHTDGNFAAKTSQEMTKEMMKFMSEVMKGNNAPQLSAPEVETPVETTVSKGKKK